MRHFDVAIVGCGAMGSSASYNLAKSGFRSITLDGHGLGHAYGSSHGGTRIIRLAYFEDPRYVPLLRRAYDLWGELGRKSGNSLLLQTGGLMIGFPSGSLIKGALSSARLHGLHVRTMSGREASSEFPAFSLRPEFDVIHDPSAGVLFPEKCIRSCVELADELGARFSFNDLVTRWRREKDGYRVQTSTGEYFADRLVFCAGPWTGELLNGVVPLRIERQVVFWFDASGDDRFRYGRMPIFIMEANGHQFYGIPDVGGGVKIARHHEGRTVKPDVVDRLVAPEDLAPVEHFVREIVPDLPPRPISSSVCLYSNTPDGNFVVDHHPYDSGVIIVSACSGHGFKFASVLGEVVSDLVKDRRTEFDMSFLRVGRFTASPASPS